MPENRVSRKDFLKLMGAAGVGLALGGLGFMSLKTDKKGGSAIQKASAQAAGTWALGQSATTVPIHATYLHNGFILYIAGSGFHSGHRDGPYEGRLLDPLTGFETDVPMFDDLFCNGSTILTNGNVLIAGGTGAYDDNVNGNCNGKWHGINVAYEFDVAGGELVPVQSMAAGRWYPTLITLKDGKVINFEGFDEFGSENRLVELYDPATKTWSIKPVTNRSDSYCIGEVDEDEEDLCQGSGAGQICFGGGPGNGTIPQIGTYPRMHLLGNGIIAYAGMHDVVRVYNPATGVFTNNVALMNSYRHYGTSVLLPLQNVDTEKGKILAAGGSPTANAAATDSVDILDFNASSTNVPVIRAVQPLQYSRKYLVPVVLPDGKVAMFGGSSQGAINFTQIPEMFDPVNETWTSLTSSLVPRAYHAVALLLADGRVWVAGGTATKGVWELRTEFFSPWYMSEDRPTISGSPTVEGYGGTITIPTQDANEIQSVSLVRLMSTTHHYEANQRFIWLQIVGKTANSVTVLSPVNGNIAPPGYYMIHILNNAPIPVPSEARIIQIDGTQAPDTNAPSQVTGLSVTVAPESALNLVWTPNSESDLDHYNIYRDTVSGFTPAAANLVAQPTTASYSDTGLNVSTTYYYRVAAVDTSNNIGPVSSEESGTPEAPGEVFYDVAFPGNSVAALAAGLSTRYGEEARVAASVLVGKSIKYWKVYLRQAGSPQGDVTAVIRRNSDDAVVAAFNETIPASSLAGSWTERTFSLSTPYVIQTGDRILLQYSGSNSVEVSFWNTDQTDGTNTRRTRYQGGSYIGGGLQDVVGTMISGPPPQDTDAPDQVAGLSVASASASQLDLVWTPNSESDLDHYNIYRDTVSGFTPAAANLVAQPTTASYSDTGLNVSTTYYYRVAAVDTSNNIGPVSSEESGTPEAPGEVFYDVPGPASNAAALRSGISIRYGVEVRNAASSLVGKSLRKWKVYLRKAQSPSGQVQARIRRASDDAIVATFNESLGSAGLPTIFTAFEFNLSTPYVLQVGDRILIEYDGPSSVDVSRTGSDAIDGSATRRIHFSGTSYVAGSTQDVAGTMSS